MNDGSTPAPNAPQPPKARLLTPRRLVIGVTLCLSAALLLLDRPTLLHWVCVALALRILVIMILAMPIHAFGGPVDRAVWGAATGIVVADIALAIVLTFFAPEYALLLVANPFGVIGSLVGAVSALSNGGLGAVTGIFSTLGCIVLLVVIVARSVGPSPPGQPLAHEGVMPFLIIASMAIAIGGTATTVLTLIPVGILSIYIRRPTHDAIKDIAVAKRQRRLRMGLQAILLLLLGTSIYLGWCIRPAFLSTRTRLVVERLRQIEGRLDDRGSDTLFVPYRPGTDHVTDARLQKIWSVALYGESLHDDDLLLLKELPSLQSLAIGGPHVSDVGIAHLKHVPSLSFLQISSTRLTGAALKELQSLNKLETLELIKCQIDDADFANLGAMKNLKSLSLEGTTISDAGLSGLKPLAGCEKIDLIGTNVGDGVVPFFKDMPNLRIVLIHQSTTRKATWDEVNQIMRDRNKSP